MNRLSSLPVATILLGLAFLVVVVVGAILLIQDNFSHDYAVYCKQVGLVAIGLGLLGIGRGRDADSKP